MTILVTGGTGFLGHHLVDKLVARGDQVRVLTRAWNPRLHDLGVEIIEGSLDNVDDLARAVQGVTRVYHLAGRVERDRAHAHTMYELHVEGTRRLLRALSDEAKRSANPIEKVVYASTSGTVGVGKSADFMARDDAPMAEEIVRNWPYYLSKIYAERVCEHFIKHHNMPIVMMRPTLLLGPGDHTQSSTGDVVQFLQKKIPATMPGGISFVDVRDTADAFIQAMDRAPAGATYLLGAANMTFNDFFKRLSQLSGIAPPRIPLPGKAAVAGARFLEHAFRTLGKTPEIDPASVEMAQYFWYIDSSRAREDLGFRPRPSNETLRDTIQWIRSHHPDMIATDATESGPRPVPPEEYVPRETVEFARTIAGQGAHRHDQQDS